MRNSCVRNDHRWLSKRKRHRRISRFEKLESRRLLAVASPVDPTTFDGSEGVRISLEGNQFGQAGVAPIGSAGDINGDGFDDLLIGELDQFGELTLAVGVIFGSDQPQPLIHVPDLNGTNGFRLPATGFRDFAPLGDFNGDGIDDFVVSSSVLLREVGFQKIYSAATVIYGRSTGFDAILDVNQIDSDIGFHVEKPTLGGITDFAAAGDINGDGLADMMIGSANEGTDAGFGGQGAAFVLFGKPSDQASEFSLASLDGSNGFRVDSVLAEADFGRAVRGAGDFNGDGYADIAISQPLGFLDPQFIRASTGYIYLIYGKPSGFAAAFNVSELGSDAYAMITGPREGSGAGISIDGVGDFDGDGFSELIVGAPGAESGLRGAVFVVPGSDSPPNEILLENSESSLRIDHDNSGTFKTIGDSVAEAGDVNGDGLTDIIFGDPGLRALGFGTTSVAPGANVLFGGSPIAGTTVDRSAFDGSSGFRITPASVPEFGATIWVDSAGDFNGDGIDDVAVSVYRENATNAGQVFIVFGKPDPAAPGILIGTSEPNQLTATRGQLRDVLIGGAGNDRLTSDGGPDILLGGQGDDRIVFSTMTFPAQNSFDGGNGFDTLEISGSGQTLDLTVLAGRRLVDIEQIDLTGSGNNSLVLQPIDVLNLSSHSNTLVIRRDVGDTVEIGDGWTQQNDKSFDNATFEVFVQGAATVMIQQAIDTTPPTLLSILRSEPVEQNTNADSLIFLATFDEAVVNIDPSDFAVVGTTTGIPTSVSAVTESSYSVTVSGGDLRDLDGTLGLGLALGVNITDTAGNPLAAVVPATSETFLIDNLRPYVESFLRQSPLAERTNEDQLVFRVVFDEAVTNVDAADFVVGGGSTAVITSTLAHSTSVYDISVSGGDLAAFDGPVRLEISPSNDINDSAGNHLLIAAPATDESFELDNRLPRLVSLTRQSPLTEATSADELVFRAMFDEPVVGVDKDDFAVAGQTTAAVTDARFVDGQTFDLIVSGDDLADFTGTVGIDLAAVVTINDVAGGALVLEEPSIDELYSVNVSDFGDAPDTYGTTLDSTIAVLGGARHISTGVTLGTERDAEADAIAPHTGSSDDASNTGSVDDEDGVTGLTDLVIGENVTIGVDIKNSAGDARLYAWFDFNGDGDFSDDGEQVADGTGSFANLGNGTLSLNFAVPATGFEGTTYARFRVSTDENLNSDGPANDGEVEDYQVTIVNGSGGPSAVLDATGNGTVNPFHDGIIIVRFMLGQPVANLATPALTPADATRTTGAEIHEYLDKTRDSLDINGDGIVNPFQDGVLIVRYLLRQPNANLEDSALIPAGSARVTGEAIRAYFDTLMTSSSEGESVHASEAQFIARGGNSEKLVPTNMLDSRNLEFSFAESTTETGLQGLALRRIATELPRITAPAPTTLIELSMPRDWDDEAASIDLALADWFVEPGMD